VAEFGQVEVSIVDEDVCGSLSVPSSDEIALRVEELDATVAFRTLELEIYMPSERRWRSVAHLIGARSLEKLKNHPEGRLRNVYLHD
jgi:hypothetical protein